MNTIKQCFALRRKLLRKLERKGWSRNARNEEQEHPKQMPNACADSWVVQVAGGTIITIGIQANGIANVVVVGALRGRLVNMGGTIGHAGQGKATALDQSLLGVLTIRESQVLPDGEIGMTMIVENASVDTANERLLPPPVLQDHPLVRSDDLNTSTKTKTLHIRVVADAVGPTHPHVRPGKNQQATNLRNLPQLWRCPKSLKTPLQQQLRQTGSESLHLN